MPYSALPSSRRIHYEIDGSALGYNINGGFGSGLATLLSGAQMLALNEETPTIDSAVTGTIGNSNTLYFYVIFPELVDLAYMMGRSVWSASGGPSITFNAIQSSVDTTNGTDGTWNTVSGSSGTLHYVEDYSGGAVDQNWWRANSPRTLTGNATGIKAIRFSITYGGANNASFRSLYLWGHKHSGETIDDIAFLEGDGSTEWPNDDDWGDILAGATSVTHTYYVKNLSGTKTANGITVKSSGSDNAQWTVSLDNASFGSSKSISSLAPGVTQVVYFKFTPPAPGNGVFLPHAGYLEADVTSWT